MRLFDWILAFFEIIFWYGFIYVGLFCIKNPIVLWQSALVLTILACAAILCCPWLRYTDGWKKMWKK